MATLVLGIGGYIAGSAAGPLGAHIGGALGALAGAAIDSLWLGPKQPPTRKEELAITAATYGKGINRTWGTQRINGELIWSFPIQKHKHSQSVGGKGLSSSAVAYTYTASFAVGLCEGPIVGILRIWADSKILVDLRPGYYGPQPIRAAAMRFYYGTETQNADPLIVAYQGSHAAAHRGLAYIVFENLRLDDFGNRVPNITAEVVTAGSSASPSTTALASTGAWANEGKGYFDPNTGFFYDCQNSIPNTIKFSALSNAQLLITTDPRAIAAFGNLVLGPDGFLYGSTGEVSNLEPMTQINPNDLSVINQWGKNEAFFSTGDWWPFARVRAAWYPGATGDVAIYGQVFAGVGNQYAASIGRIYNSGTPAGSTAEATASSPIGISFGRTVGLTADEVAILTAAGITSSPGDFIAYNAVELDQDGNFWGLSSVGTSAPETGYDASLLSTAFLARLVPAGGQDGGITIAEVINLTSIFSAQLAAASGNKANFLLIAGTNQFLIAIAGEAIKYDMTSRAQVASLLNLGSAACDFDESWNHGLPDGYFVAQQGAGDIYITDINGWAQVYDLKLSDYALGYGPGSIWYWFPRTRSVWNSAANGVLGTSAQRYTQLFVDRITPGGVSLEDVANDIASEAGIIGEALRACVVNVTGSVITLATDHPHELRAGDSFTTANFSQGALNGSFTVQDTQLGSVIRFDCGTGGLSAGDSGNLTSGAGLLTDASQLASVTVRGFTIPRETPARSALEQLRTAFFFDAVESDYLLKFVKRGGDPAANLADMTDMGGVDTAGNFEDPVKVRIGAIDDLPWEIALTFVNPNHIYQQGVQRFRRDETVIGTRNRQSIDVPVCLTDDDARSIAESLMMLAYLQRMGFEGSTSLANVLLDGADTIHLTVGADTYVVRLTKVEIGANGIVKLIGELDDPEAYAASPASGGGDTTPLLPTPPITIISPSVLFILDINALRDSEADQTDGGYYLAGGAADENLEWDGESVYVSTDGGADFSLFDTLYDEMTWGSTVDALPAPTRSWCVWDRSSPLTVRIIGTGTPLASAASDLAVLNGANAALVGSEIIQFRDVVDNGDGTFTLTKLLRGRRGTEWAIASHTAGERFVLLVADGSIVNEHASTADIGLARLFKPVSIGDDSLPPTSIGFSNTGARLKPYAPHAPLGARDMSSNLTVTWIRRTRQGGDNSWLDAVTEVPLSEASESYAVDILDNSGNVLRTLTSSTPSATYSAADQTTDFGSPQASVAVKVYQISAVIGRGYALSATV